MIDEPADVARLRRVRGGDILQRDSRPPSLVIDVGLELAEWPEGNPASPRRPFSVPPLMGVSDAFEPLEHDRLVVRPRLLHDQGRDPVEGLLHALLLSSGTCELLLETPVVRMSFVELGAPNPVEGVEASDLREVVHRAVAPNDGLLVQVVADLPGWLFDTSLLREGDDDRR